MRARPGAAAVATLLTIAALACSSHRLPRFGSDFEQDDALDLLNWKCLTLLRLSKDHATSGTRSLEISFYPAPDGQPDHYPGVSFVRFDSDWRRYRQLVFDAYNPKNVALALRVRIDDREAPEYADRVNRTLHLSPGANRICLPLEGLVTSGTKRKLDLCRIRTVILFLSRPQEEHTLYLDNLELQ